MYRLERDYMILVKLLAVAVFGYGLSGCATTQLREADVPVAGQVLVAGSIEIIEDGKRKKCGRLLGLDNKCNIFVLPAGSAQSSVYGVSEDGDFTWSLAPGSYTIAAFQISEGSRSGRLWVGFTVPQGVQGVYIGDLVLHMEQGLYRMEVQDNYGTAAESYRAAYPAASSLPEKRLMETEPELGAFDSMQYICAEDWGIECNNEYRGITPLEPEPATLGSTTVDSLMPAFAWLPSSATGISYDLVLYEAFSYSLDGIVSKQMPGRVVAYVEGLETPAWQPAAPLKPAQNYYWSVRLRRDGTVSSWSRYSYFAFFLVGWASGSGQWFSFTTP